MATVLRLGPHEHGRVMTFEEFIAGDYEQGYCYELIEGKLYVSPHPNQTHDWITRYVQKKLMQYSESHPEAINCVSGAARVFVPGAEATTAPEPDIAAYRDFPAGPDVHWRDVSPVLVVEVLGGKDDEKDLVRNVDLYLRVPSIQEYWVFDIRQDPRHPTLIVHRRQETAWDVSELASDTVYTTDLLPDFSLAVAPSD